MGVMDFISGSNTTKEEATQFHIRYDNKAEFRKLEIEAAFLVEKNQDEQVLKGWRHVFKNQFACTGYKSVKPCMVTISHDRDILFDPFNLVPDNEKPDMNELVVLPQEEENPTKVRKVPQFLIDVGNAQIRKKMAQAGKQTAFNRLIIILGSIAGLEFGIICIIALLKYLG